MKPSKEIVAHLERCFEQQMTQEQVDRLKARKTERRGWMFDDLDQQVTARKKL